MCAACCMRYAAARAVRCALTRQDALERVDERGQHGRVLWRREVLQHAQALDLRYRPTGRGTGRREGGGRRVLGLRLQRRWAPAGPSSHPLIYAQPRLETRLLAVPTDGSRPHTHTPPVAALFQCTLPRHPSPTEPQHIPPATQYPPEARATRCHSRCSPGAHPAPSAAPARAPGAAHTARTLHRG